MLDSFVGHHFKWDTECRVNFSIGGWSGLINGLQKEMSESSSPVPENVSLEIRSLQMESSLRSKGEIILDLVWALNPTGLPQWLSE